MTTETAEPSQDWLNTRPQARTNITIGPALLAGSRSVHVVADHETGGYLRMGPREAFILTHLDGSRTLHEIDGLYADRFGRRLDAGHWQQILTLFGQRALLVPADASVIADARQRATAARVATGHSPFRYRIPIPGAAATVRRAAPYLSWLLHPAVVTILTIAGVASSAALLIDWRDLAAAAGASPQWWSSALAAIAIIWLLIAAHEVGHAIACTRYGGEPTEIGLMWRAPLVAPYCKVDDVVTFPRRGQRVMTAFAGVYVNLAAQPLLLLVWAQGSPTGWWGAGLAFVIFANTATIVVNLLPVLQLDGYHMLEHATGSLALQKETIRFVTGAVRQRSTFTDSYEPRARWTYASYALLAAFLLGPMVATLVGSWYVTMADLWNPAVSATILLVEAFLVLLLIRWGMSWTRRREAQRVAAIPVPSAPPTHAWSSPTSPPPIPTPGDTRG